MYVSRVVNGCGVVSWVGGVTSKLSGLCGSVQGACGRWSDVVLCCSFEYCVATMSMASCGVLGVVLVSGCLSVVTLGWSLERGSSPALVLRLL
jgi:hypothetical protein